MMRRYQRPIFAAMTIVVALSPLSVFGQNSEQNSTGSGSPAPQAGYPGRKILPPCA